MSVALDAHNLDGQHFVLVDDLARVRDASIDEFGNVNQAFDGTVDADESAEGDQLGDLAGDNLANLIAGDDIVPLFGARAPDGEPDFLRLLVDLHHVDIDVATDRKHLLGVDVALPGELGEVDQAVGAAQVDEDAEAADARDATAADFAFAQLRQQAVLLFGAPLLHGGALGEDDAVSASVDLDHFESQRATNEFVEVAAAGVGLGRGAHDLAERHEGVDAFHVDQQASLVEATHSGFKGDGFLEAGLQLAPALFTAGAVNGDGKLGLFAVGLEDVDEDAVADLEAVALLGSERVHLVGRDNALGFGANVDDQGLAVASNDDAFNHVAAAEFDEIMPLFSEELFHGRLFGLIGSQGWICVCGRPAVSVRWDFGRDRTTRFGRWAICWGLRSASGP